jgi:hypothetical protein
VHRRNRKRHPHAARGLSRGGRPAGRDRGREVRRWTEHVDGVAGAAALACRSAEAPAARTGLVKTGARLRSATAGPDRHQRPRLAIPECAGATRAKRCAAGRRCLFGPNRQASSDPSSTASRRPGVLRSDGPRRMGARGPQPRGARAREMRARLRRGRERRERWSPGAQRASAWTSCPRLGGLPFKRRRGSADATRARWSTMSFAPRKGRRSWLVRRRTMRHTTETCGRPFAQSQRAALPPARAAAYTRRR